MSRPSKLQHLAALESLDGQALGDAGDPLLVSVRSGAKFSMPGMMDTVLNLGPERRSRSKGLAAQTGDDLRFARDAYRRFIQMFGKIVMDVPADAFEHALDEAKERKGPDAQDTDLDADDLAALIDRFRAIYREHTGEDFPQEPKDQLRLAIDAVFQSWNGKRAIDYRRQNKICDDLGTAVNIVAMVFGNRGEDSGTGVAFTRDPSTGEKVPYGDYLAERAGRGRRRRHPQHAAARRSSSELDPASYEELRDGDGHARGALPRHVRHRVHDREAASSGSCRRGSASARRSPNGSWPTTCCSEGLISPTRRCSASTRTGWRSCSSARDRRRGRGARRRSRRA